MTAGGWGDCGWGDSMFGDRFAVQDMQWGHDGDQEHQK